MLTLFSSPLEVIQVRGRKDPMYINRQRRKREKSELSESAFHFSRDMIRHYLYVPRIFSQRIDEGVFIVWPTIQSVIQLYGCFG